MDKYTSFSKLWADLKNDEEFLTEKNILEFTLQLHQLMECLGISQKELSRRVGSSEAYITKVFKGNANFTIATMTKLSKAIGGRVAIHVIKKEEKNPRWFRAIEGRKKTLPRWQWQTEEHQETEIYEGYELVEQVA